MNTKNSDVDTNVIGNMLRVLEKNTGLKLAVQPHDFRNEWALYEVTVNNLDKVASWDTQISEYLSLGALYDVIYALINMSRIKQKKEIEN